MGEDEQVDLGLNLDVTATGADQVAGLSSSLGELNTQYQASQDAQATLAQQTAALVESFQAQGVSAQDAAQFLKAGADAASPYGQALQQLASGATAAASAQQAQASATEEGSSAAQAFTGFTRQEAEALAAATSALNGNTEGLAARNDAILTQNAAETEASGTNRTYVEALLMNGAASKEADAATKGLGSSLQQGAMAMNLMGGAAGPAGQALQSAAMGASMFGQLLPQISAETALTVTGIAALAAGVLVLGENAVSSAVGLQQSEAALASYSQISVSQANAIGQAFRTSGQASVFSAQETVAALAPMSQVLTNLAGGSLSVKDAQTAMAAATNLAEASGAKLSTTTHDLITVMNAYGLGVGQASQASDILFNTSRNTGLGIDQISQAVEQLTGRLGPLAPSLGETGGLLSELASHGVEGSQGLRLVGQAADTLFSGTTQVDGALASLGVSLTDSSGKSLDFFQALQQLTPALLGMSDAQRHATEDILFGKNAWAEIDPLIKDNIDLQDQFVQKVGQSGTAAKGAADQTGTFSGQVKELSSEIANLGASIGTEALAPLQALTGALKEAGLAGQQGGEAIKMGVLGAIPVFGQLDEAVHGAGAILGFFKSTAHDAFDSTKVDAAASADSIAQSSMPEAEAALVTFGQQGQQTAVVVGQANQDMATSSKAAASDISASANDVISASKAIAQGKIEEAQVYTDAAALETQAADAQAKGDTAAAQSLAALAKSTLSWEEIHTAATQRIQTNVSNYVGYLDDAAKASAQGNEVMATAYRAAAQDVVDGNDASAKSTIAAAQVLEAQNTAQAQSETKLAATRKTALAESTDAQIAYAKGYADVGDLLTQASQAELAGESETANALKEKARVAQESDSQRASSAKSANSEITQSDRDASLAQIAALKGDTAAATDYTAAAQAAVDGNAVLASSLVDSAHVAEAEFAQSTKAATAATREATAAANDGARADEDRSRSLAALSRGKQFEAQAYSDASALEAAGDTRGAAEAIARGQAEQAAADATVAAAKKDDQAYQQMLTTMDSVAKARAALSQDERTATDLSMSVQDELLAKHKGVTLATIVDDQARTEADRAAAQSAYAVMEAAWQDVQDAVTSGDRVVIEDTLKTFEVLRGIAEQAGKNFQSDLSGQTSDQEAYNAQMAKLATDLSKAEQQAGKDNASELTTLGHDTVTQHTLANAQMLQSDQAMAAQSLGTVEGLYSQRQALNQKLIADTTALRDATAAGATADIEAAQTAVTADNQQIQALGTMISAGEAQYSQYAAAVKSDLTAIGTEAQNMAKLTTDSERQKYLGLIADASAYTQDALRQEQIITSNASDAVKARAEAALQGDQQRITSDSTATAELLKNAATWATFQQQAAGIADQATRDHFLQVAADSITTEQQLEADIQAYVNAVLPADQAAALSKIDADQKRIDSDKQATDIMIKDAQAVGDAQDQTYAHQTDSLNHQLEDLQNQLQDTQQNATDAAMGMGSFGSSMTGAAGAARALGGSLAGVSQSQASIAGSSADASTEMLQYVNLITEAEKVSWDLAHAQDQVAADQATYAQDSLRYAASIKMVGQDATLSNDTQMSSVNQLTTAEKDQSTTERESAKLQEEALQKRIKGIQDEIKSISESKANYDQFGKAATKVYNDLSDTGSADFLTLSKSGTSSLNSIGSAATDSGATITTAMSKAFGDTTTVSHETQVHASADMTTIGQSAGQATADISANLTPALQTADTTAMQAGNDGAAAFGALAAEAEAAVVAVEQLISAYVQLIGLEKQAGSGAPASGPGGGGGGSGPAQHAMAQGGLLGEPVFGVGLSSGETYSIGEEGPEMVVPLGVGGGSDVGAFGALPLAGAGGGAGHVIVNMTTYFSGVIDATTADTVAQALGPAMERQLGGALGRYVRLG